MLHSETAVALLITAVALTLVATLLSRLHVPTIVGFVLTGVLIGPSGIDWIPSLPAAQTISELGIIFLMFVLGLEISLEHLRRLFVPLMSLGFAQVAGTGLISGLFFHFALGFSMSKSFLFASCLALSSTAVVLKLLQEKRETETPYGRVSIVVLLFQDIASLPLMAAIPVMASAAETTHSWSSLGLALGWIVIFLVACILTGYFVIPTLFSEVARTRSREVFFFSLISTTFVIAFLAETAGLSMSLGAFLAGVLISESPYSKQALAELSPFRDIFLGFFFASVGMMVDLKFLYENWLNFVWLIPTMFLIKFGVTYLVVRRNSHSHGVSFASALALTQIGEFSFILAASAFSHKIIDTQEFQYFLCLAVSSLLFAPLMYSFAVRGSAHSSWPELARTLAKAFQKESESVASASLSQLSKEETVFAEGAAVAPRRTVVIGLGHAGIRALQELTKNGIPCVGIDLNLQNVNTAKKLGVEGIYGDSTSPDVLESAGIATAFLVVITVSGHHITPQVLATVRRLNPTVKILARVHYLKELNEVKDANSASFIVSESETANALATRALGFYGIDTAAPLPLA